MQEPSGAERLEGELLIRRLQAELRTEEMKLVLLKKIRQTQILAQQQQQANAAAIAAPSAPDVKSGTSSCIASAALINNFKNLEKKNKE